MTTQDFIAKWYNVNDSTERFCSSVYKDGRGYIYSYGPHYPLVFEVAGKTFVNDAGYSMTTAKHISWAKGAVGYGNFTPVQLDREASRVISQSYATDAEKLKELERVALKTAKDLVAERDGKKRKNTWVFKNLQDQANRAIDTVITLQTIGGTK